MDLSRTLGVRAAVVATMSWRLELSAFEQPLLPPHAAPTNALPASLELSAFEQPLLPLEEEVAGSVSNSRRSSSRCCLTGASHGADRWRASRTLGVRAAVVAKLTAVGWAALADVSNSRRSSSRCCYDELASRTLGVRAAVVAPGETGEVCPHPKVSNSRRSSSRCLPGPRSTGRGTSRVSGSRRSSSRCCRFRDDVDVDDLLSRTLGVRAAVVAEQPTDVVSTRAASRTLGVRAAVVAECMSPQDRQSLRRKCLGGLLSVTARLELSAFEQ